MFNSSESSVKVQNTFQAQFIILFPTEHLILPSGFFTSAPPPPSKKKYVQ